MADWNTHLYCAHRVNEALGYKGIDLDMFLYGNLLPDVNMGWIIEPEVCLEQKDTHFDAIGQEYFWAPLRFCEKYSERIKAQDPLFLGYLFHLWLDVSIMTDFVSRVPMSDMVNRYHEVREWKWKDIGIFIKGHQYSLSAEHISEIAERSGAIEEVQVTERDLLRVQEYVTSGPDEYEGEEYFLYTSDELATFYEKTCKDFIKWVTT